MLHPQDDRFPTLEERLRHDDDVADASSVPPSRGFGITAGERQSNALARLRRVAVERDEVEREIAYRVTRCRELGVSWAEVGVMLGVTKQSAQRKYADPLCRCGKPLSHLSAPEESRDWACRVPTP